MPARRARARAQGEIEDKAENLGEILMGDRIENSNYEVCRDGRGGRVVVGARAAD